MNPFVASPKDRFRNSNTRISNHREMVGTDTFERATDTALLQYMAAVSQGVRDANSALAAGFRLQGAFELMHTLKNLSEAPIVPTVDRSPDNLDHKA